jgi:thioredoxin 1
MNRAARLLAVLGLCLALFAPGCSPPERAVKITSNNFDALVLQSKQPVLVDFWAEWCGPCKSMDPIIQALAVEFEGKAVVGKINVDENPDIVDKYRIEGFPTYLIFKNGQLRKTIPGKVPKFFLSDQLEALQ